MTISDLVENDHNLNDVTELGLLTTRLVPNGKSFAPLSTTLRTQDFSTCIAGFMTEEEELFNSRDVVSLFTNTPIDKVLEVICSRLEKQ